MAFTLQYACKDSRPPDSKLLKREKTRHANISRSFFNICRSRLSEVTLCLDHEDRIVEDVAGDGRFLVGAEFVARAQHEHTALVGHRVEGEF